MHLPFWRFLSLLNAVHAQKTFGKYISGIRND